MGDFYQNGIVTTLHNLSQRSTDSVETELLKFSEDRKLGLDTSVSLLGARDRGDAKDYRGAAACPT